MIVFDLLCAAGHPFEGWFGSAEDFASQQARSLVQCPNCGSGEVRRVPSAARFNLGAEEPRPAKAPEKAPKKTPEMEGKDPFAIAQMLYSQMLDELLLEPPEPRLLVAVLVQISVVWRSLGSIDAAHAFLERAAAHVRPGSHRESGWIHHQRALVQIDAGEFETAARSLRNAETGYRRARATHDRALVLISFARLGFARGHAKEAVDAAGRAARFAMKHAFARLHLFALLEKARALQLAGASAESRGILRTVLADSLVADDSVVRFHAHYYLWKAELVGGERTRADIELREASYHLRFVDQSSPEAAEVRKAAAPLPVIVDR
jgi:ATP/maltotriose-dependent transcriptional regulator MalT